MSTTNQDYIRFVPVPRATVERLVRIYDSDPQISLASAAREAGISSIAASRYLKRSGRIVMPRSRPLSLDLLYAVDEGIERDMSRSEIAAREHTSYQRIWQYWMRLKTDREHILRARAMLGEHATTAEAP